MSVGVAHKIPGSLYIILGHTLRSKCPGGASGGEPGSASKSAEGARYEKAVGIRTAWADRMYVETRAEGDYGLESTTGIGRGEHAEANMEDGGRRRASNVATRYNRKYA